MAKILVLDTHDSHLGGHGWSTAEYLRKMGHEVCFLSLYKKNISTENYFYNLQSIRGKIKYYLTYYIRDLIAKKIFLRPQKRYAFVSSYLWGKSAESILKKVPFKPEIIVLTWVPGFITPKIVRDLYDKTRAKIVFQMVDEALLSLCHYHKDCNGYKDCCRKCPNVHGMKSIPRFVMAKKNQFWSDMPAYIICTTYDKNFAEQVPFLQHMRMWTNVAVPNVSPTFTKAKARKYFGISNEDFVIFAGSNDLMNTEKGLSYVIEATNIMVKKQLTSTRKVTLLILGHNSDKVEIKITNSINIIKKDFLPKEHFFKAYYACDVHASATLYDSGPMMVNYAFACGRPVVSFPVGVALDLVENGKTGYMVPFKDITAFSEGLYKLYRASKEELNLMSQSCIDKIHSFRNKNFWENIGFMK